MEDTQKVKINKEPEIKKIKYKRIGTMTFGLILILIGILSVVFMFTDANLFRYVVMLWPLFLVSLGIETLYYSNKTDIVIKYDVWNIILTTCIIGFTILLSIGNFVVNEVFFKNDRMQRFVNRAIEEIESDFRYTDDEIREVSNIIETIE